MLHVHILSNIMQDLYSQCADNTLMQFAVCVKTQHAFCVLDVAKYDKLGAISMLEEHNLAQFKLSRYNLPVKYLHKLNIIEHN